MAQRALDEAIQQAKTREAFGAPIAKLQAIQWMIADMACRVEAARLLTYKAAIMQGNGERFGLAASQAKLYASEAANFELAVARFQESEELYKNLELPHLQAWAIRGLSMVSSIRGDYAQAQAFAEKSLSLYQQTQDEAGLVWVHFHLGSIALACGDLPKSETLLEDCLNSFWEHGWVVGAFRVHISIGHLRRAQGRLQEAYNSYQKALAIQQKTGYIRFVAQIFEGLAHIAVQTDQIETSVNFLGIAQARLDTLETIRWAYQEKEFKKSLSLTKDLLPPTIWQSSWDQGCRMEQKDTFHFALNENIF